MRSITFLLFFFVSGPWSFAQSSNPVADALITNGTIQAMVRDGNTLYIGGGFQFVGPSVDFGAALNGTTGVVVPSYLKPNGTVYASIPDGSGGWYIGGDFTSVGGQTRNRLARINSDGTLHGWDPRANGIVRTLALSGSTVYIGGHFTSLSPNGGTSVTRNRLAAVDASTGAVITAWDPRANDRVNSLAVSGSTVYVGGQFTSLSPNGGTSVTRNRLAAVDAGTGAVITGWDPNANGTVNTLAVSGSTVYVGGAFNGSNSINGNTTRNRLAAVDASTGTVTAWDPNANGTVNTLVVSGSTVYVGGVFYGENSINGNTTRNHLAAVNATSGAVTSWNPNSSNEVRTLAEQSGTIYAGGDFISIGGEVRNNLAAVDVSTGQLTTWNPNANGTVWALALSGSTLYAGGDFSNIGVQNRSRIAAFNTTDGTVTDWNPNVTGGSIRAIAVGSSTVYIGGNFSNAGGQTRNRIAALDATVNTNNAISTWNPGASELVRVLAISGSTLYVGGDFNVLDGGVYTDDDDAVMNGEKNAGDPLNPNYPTIGGATRNYLAALNTSNGTVTNWNPDPNGIVLSLAANAGIVYAGGSFTTIGPAGNNVGRNRLAALDATTAIPTTWNPGASNTVGSLAVSGSAVYAGGSFTSFTGGITRNRLAALNINTGIPTDWNPNSGGTINSIVVGTSGVYAGGGFSTIGSVSLRNFAAFPITSVQWGGSSGGSWNQASNWIPGIIPGSTLDVSIAAGYPLIDVDFSLPAGKTLTLSGTGSLTVAPGKSLTVAGTADFGGKSVTFKSDATGTARLGVVSGTLSNATNVSIERYLPAGRKWRLLTAPLKGISNNSVFANWQNNDVVAAGTGVEIWSAGGDANPSNSNSGMAIGGGASMRSYGSSGWANVTSTNTSVLFDNETNYGYALFAAGPYNNGTSVISSSTAAQNTTLTATGTLITGDHTKSFTASAANQFFLVGNPYASPVDPRSFTETPTVNRTNLNGKLWMWDAKPGAGIGNGLGRYVSFDMSINQYNVLGDGYADHNVMIQSGQAFFVQATASGAATLVFREASKDATSSHAMMGDAIDKKAVLRLTLQETVGDSSENLDGAVAVFHAAGKSGLDPLDGQKLMNTSENLSLRRNDRNLSFEHRPEVGGTDTLMLRIGNMRTQAYVLEASADGFTQKDMTATLVDRLTGQRRLLDVGGITRYSFTVSSDSLSTGDRFMVVFGGRINGSGVTPESSSVSPELRLFPNPATSRLGVRYTVTMAGSLSLRVYDARGALVMDRTVEDHTGTGLLELNTSALPGGMYRVLLTDGAGSRQTQTFIRR